MNDENNFGLKNYSLAVNSGFYKKRDMSEEDVPWAQVQAPPPPKKRAHWSLFSWWFPNKELQIPTSAQNTGQSVVDPSAKMHLSSSGPLPEEVL